MVFDLLVGGSISIVRFRGVAGANSGVWCVVWLTVGCSVF